MEYESEMYCIAVTHSENEVYSQIRTKTCFLTKYPFKQMKLLKLKDVHKIKVAKCMFSASKGILPSPLICMITNNSSIHTHDTRNTNNPHVNTRRTNIAAKTIRHIGPQME